MPSYIEKTKTLTMPIIPLQGVVVFPSLPITLEIGSKKSIEACNAAAGSDGYIFLAALRDADKEWVTEADGYYRVGTVARITKLAKMKNGSLTLTAEGVSRGEIASVMNMHVQYAEVICKTFDFDPDSLKVQSLTHEVIKLYDEFLATVPNLAKNIERHVRTCSNPAKLADLIAATLIIQFEDKQDILEEFEPVRRLELLVFKMRHELEYLENELEIHKKVRARIDENQREYYMREQIKVLKEELGDDGSIDEDFREYASRIAAAVSFPDYVTEKLYKEAEKLTRLPYGSAERSVVMGYLDVCLKIPFGVMTETDIDTVKAKKVLDDDHFGLTSVKDRILEYLSVLKLKGGVKSQIICLVGAPGVGKTSVASSIARAMNRKFVRVALGGVRDEADIRGHRKTYLASMPGRLVNALIEAETQNPVILLDEIDKLTRDIHGDPSSALLEALDPDQNKNFRDHFVEIPVDLSDAFFICTANTLSTIPKPLLDRMEVIELHSYTPEEKLEIAKKYLLPKTLSRHGLTKKILSINDVTLSAIIEKYTFEAGVRALERELAKICRKVAKKYLEGEKRSFRIKPSDLYLYLGPEKIKEEDSYKEPLVGVVNGLAYTEAGGDILRVEAISMPGTGKLSLTGSLGEVMKESGQIAYSVVRSRAEGLGIDPDFYKNTDVHVHFPEGAVPKEGPSAGVTLVTVLVSRLSGHPVRADIAMTGEVTLSGKVLAIGGVREKVTAAKRAKVKCIILPYENRQDVESLEDYIKEGIEFILCKTVDEVLIHALASDSEHDTVADMAEHKGKVRKNSRTTRGIIG